MTTTQELKGMKANANWSEARKAAFAKFETNPGAYYYRFNAPGEEDRHGPWSEEEKQLFLQKLNENGHQNYAWGLFSQSIPGRCGYQCASFYRKLVKSGEINDPNYPLDENKKTPKKTDDGSHILERSQEISSDKENLDGEEPTNKSSSRHNTRHLTINFAKLFKKESSSVFDFDSDEEGKPKSKSECSQTPIKRLILRKNASGHYDVIIPGMSPSTPKTSKESRSRAMVKTKPLETRPFQPIPLPPRSLVNLDDFPSLNDQLDSESEPIKIFLQLTGRYKIPEESLNFKEAAIFVLAHSKRFLTGDEIASIAVKKGIVKTNGKTPGASISSQLNVDINKNGDASCYVKFGAGQFSIRPKFVEHIKNNVLFDWEVNLGMTLLEKSALKYIPLEKEPDWLEVKPSGIPESGEGLFAKYPITCGTVLCEYKGRIVLNTSVYEITNELYPYAVSVRMADDSIAVIDGLDLDGKTVLSYGPRANDAGLVFQNTLLAEYKEHPGRVFLEACRNIQAGEEIFVTYGPNYWGIKEYPVYKTVEEYAQLPFLFKQKQNENQTSDNQDAIPDCETVATSIPSTTSDTISVEENPSNMDGNFVSKRLRTDDEMLDMTPPKKLKIRLGKGILTSEKVLCTELPSCH